ncbi:MAG: hypothetical protein Kow0063_25720 [Anaerolineae bacterium]
MGVLEIARKVLGAPCSGRLCDAPEDGGQERLQGLSEKALRRKGVMPGNATKGRDTQNQQFKRIKEEDER